MNSTGNRKGKKEPDIIDGIKTFLRFHDPIHLSAQETEGSFERIMQRLNCETVTEHGR